MKRIRSLAGIMRAARDRRAVVCRKLGHRHMPAAFVAEMSGATIHWLLGYGIYLHERKP